MNFNQFSYGIRAKWTTGTICLFPIVLGRTVVDFIILRDIVRDLVCVWVRIKNENYFTIQFIFITIYSHTVFFGTIHESYCIISTNFYFYL